MLSAKYVLLPLCLFAPLMTHAETPIYSSSNSTYIEGSHFHRVISLTPNPYSESSCPEITQEVDETDGYSMQVEKSYSGSFMMAHSWWFPDLSQWAVVGVGPTASRYVIFMGNALGDNAIKKFKDKKIPLKKEELDQWQEGDAVFWNSEGGVAVSAGTGISPLHIGTKYTVKGSWAHYVEKTGPQKVFASMVNRSVQSVSLSGGILYLGAGIDLIKEKIKSRSYEIELVDTEHIIAYREFLRGDEDSLLTLIQKGSDKITPIEVIKSKKYSNDFAIGAATPLFPIISWRVSRNNSRQVEHGEASWGTIRNKYWGVYSWQTKYRAIVLDFRKYKQFLAGTQTAKVPNYDIGGLDEVQTYFGSLEYIFEADHGREGRLENQFNNFLQATGLYQYCIKVPDIERTLRYHNISHKIDFSQTFIKRLIEVSAQKTASLAIEKNISATVSSMISDNKKEACGNELVEDCQFKLEQKAQKDLKKLTPKLDQLGDAQINSLEMAKAFSLVGRVLSHSPVLYRLFYEEGKACGMTVKLEVSGRRLTKLVKNESFEESEDCFN